MMALNFWERRKQQQKPTGMLVGGCPMSAVFCLLATKTKEGLKRAKTSFLKTFKKARCRIEWLNVCLLQKEKKEGGKKVSDCAVSMQIYRKSFFIFFSHMGDADFGAEHGRA